MPGQNLDALALAALWPQMVAMQGRAYRGDFTIDMRGQQPELRRLALELPGRVPDENGKVTRAADMPCPSLDEDTSLYEVFTARQRAFFAS